MARGRGRRGGGRGRGRGGGRGGGAEDDDPDDEVQASMGMYVLMSVLMISPPHRHTWRALTGQNSNAGMLPPSDSDEDSEDEKVPVKAKQMTVNQVSRPTPTKATVHCVLSLTIVLTMQPATAGMLPPSDSEEESSSEEEEDKKPKTTSASKPLRPAVAPTTKKYASCVSSEH